MPTDIIVYLDERPAHPDADRERQRYQPGLIVTAKPYRASPLRLPPASMGMLRITDAEMSQVAAYLEQWQQLLDYEVVAHNATLDGYRVRLWATQAGASLAAAVTRDQVEAYLTRWRASVYSVASNEVVFDVGMFAAVCSEGFWRVDVTGITWEETYYDSASGLRRTSTDYSARSAWQPQDVERRITEAGGTIVSHANYVVEWSITRSQVLAALKADITERADRIHARRRWYLPSGVVQALRDAPDRTLSVTRAQVLGYLRDRLED